MTGAGQDGEADWNSAAPMSTTAGKLTPHAAWPARILVAPKASVVSPLGTSAFEPASIVGLDAVSLPSEFRLGGAQMLPGPRIGPDELNAAQTSEYW